MFTSLKENLLSCSTKCSTSQVNRVWTCVRPQLSEIRNVRESAVFIECYLKLGIVPISLSRTFRFSLWFRFDSASGPFVTCGSALDWSLRPDGGRLISLSHTSWQEHFILTKLVSLCFNFILWSTHPLGTGGMRIISCHKAVLGICVMTFADSLFTFLCLASIWSQISLVTSVHDAIRLPPRAWRNCCRFSSQI
jgi:hypothetical protein